MVESLRSAVAEARRHGDLYFAALLSQDRIAQAFGEAISLWQGWIYTPAVTVWERAKGSEVVSNRVIRCIGRLIVRLSFVVPPQGGPCSASSCQ